MWWLHLCAYKVIGQVIFEFHATFIVIWQTAQLTLSAVVKGGQSGIMAVFTHKHPNIN